MKNTYWKNIKTGLIYIYTRGTTPHNVEDWKEVTANDYNEALNLAWAKFTEQ